VQSRNVTAEGTKDTPHQNLGTGAMYVELLIIKKTLHLTRSLLGPPQGKEAKTLDVVFHHLGPVGKRTFKR